MFKCFFDWISGGEKKDWKYRRVEVEVQSIPFFEGREQKAMYKMPVRYTEDEIQIKVGPPKWRRNWQSIQSDSLEEKIRNKL